MRGHIARKGNRFYPVISVKDPDTGKWKRNWHPGHSTKREAKKAMVEAASRANIEGGPDDGAHSEKG